MSFLQDGERETEHFTYAELDRAARAIAGAACLGLVAGAAAAADEPPELVEMVKSGKLRGNCTRLPLTTLAQDLQL